MKPEPPQLASLSAMIKRNLDAIERLHRELCPLAAALSVPAPALRDVAAAAYVLHNIYGALENTFEQISRTFENHITDPVQWHRELLTKMFLEIPKIRPAVIPQDLRGVLNDLSGFRHVFRHAYEYELDPEKIALLIRDWNKARTQLISSLDLFRESLLRDLP